MLLSCAPEIKVIKTSSDYCVKHCIEEHNSSGNYIIIEDLSKKCEDFWYQKKCCVAKIVEEGLSSKGSYKERPFVCVEE